MVETFLILKYGSIGNAYMASRPMTFDELSMICPGYYDEVKGILQDYEDETLAMIRRYTSYYEEEDNEIDD